MEKTREREPGAVVLAEDVVLSRFTEKALAALLLAALDRKELTALAPRLGLNPLPGKRLKTMKPPDHARLLAKATLASDSARGPILAALNDRLPAPLFPPEERPAGEAADTALRVARLLPTEQRVALVLALIGDDAAAPKAVAALEEGLLEPGDTARDDGAAEQAKLRAKLARAEHRADEAEKQRAGERRAIHTREKGLKQRIEELQREQSELQQRLGDKNRDHDLLRKEWETLKGDLRVAFNRAARFKNALDEAKSSTERETELKNELVRARQRADIAEMKLEILEYQLDILEQEEPEEAEAPAAADDALPGRVLEFAGKVGRPPRVLVVGGAGKQRVHRERDFQRLVETLGVDGEWRFADYTSWHRELPRLKNDMRDRFDLVFVLHWNRTTFVQKMHDEARAVNARVRTVPYVGFLSLEKAVREEVERFVAERI